MQSGRARRACESQLILERSTLVTNNGDGAVIANRRIAPIDAGSPVVLKPFATSRPAPHRSNRLKRGPWVAGRVRRLLRRRAWPRAVRTFSRSSSRLATGVASQRGGGATTRASRGFQARVPPSDTALPGSVGTGHPDPARPARAPLRQLGRIFWSRSGPLAARGETIGEERGTCHRFAAGSFGCEAAGRRVLEGEREAPTVAPVSRKRRRDGLDRAAQSATTRVTPRRASIQ